MCCCPRLKTEDEFKAALTWEMIGRAIFALNPNRWKLNDFYQAKYAECSIATSRRRWRYWCRYWNMTK